MDGVVKKTKRDHGVGEPIPCNEAVSLWVERLLEPVGLPDCWPRRAVLAFLKIAPHFERRAGFLGGLGQTGRMVLQLESLRIWRLDGGGVSVIEHGIFERKKVRTDSYLLSVITKTTMSHGIDSGSI